MGFRFTSNLAAELGRISYAEAYRLQKYLLDLVKRSEAPGFLLFLEHDPVYTVGRKPITENFPGVPVVETERGGDVTYHGPGQQVIYPIVRVSDGGGLDVRGFVHFVENVVIGILENAGYSAFVGDEPGIWVTTNHGKRKVASLGMAIDHGVSYHGVSVNTGAEVLSGFDRIRPCGLDPSLMDYAEVGSAEIRDGFLSAFSERFGEFIIMSREDFLGKVSFPVLP